MDNNFKLPSPAPQNLSHEKDVTRASSLNAQLNNWNRGNSSRPRLNSHPNSRISTDTSMGDGTLRTCKKRLYRSDSYEDNHSNRKNSDITSQRIADGIKRLRIEDSNDSDSGDNDTYNSGQDPDITSQGVADRIKKLRIEDSFHFEITLLDRGLEIMIRKKSSTEESEPLITESLNIDRQHLATMSQDQKQSYINSLLEKNISLTDLCGMLKVYYEDHSEWKIDSIKDEVLKDEALKEQIYQEQIILLKNFLERDPDDFFSIGEIIKIIYDNTSVKPGIFQTGTKQEVKKEITRLHDGNLVTLLEILSARMQICNASYIAKQCLLEAITEIQCYSVNEFIACYLDKLQKKQSLLEKIEYCRQYRNYENIFSHPEHVNEIRTFFNNELDKFLQMEAMQSSVECAEVCAALDLNDQIECCLEVTSSTKNPYIITFLAEKLDNLFKSQAEEYKVKFETELQDKDIDKKIQFCLEANNNAENQRNSAVITFLKEKIAHFVARKIYHDPSQGINLVQKFVQEWVGTDALKTQEFYSALIPELEGIKKYEPAKIEHYNKIIEFLNKPPTMNGAIKIIAGTPPLERLNLIRKWAKTIEDKKEFYESLIEKLSAEEDISPYVELITDLMNDLEFLRNSGNV